MNLSIHIPNARILRLERQTLKMVKKTNPQLSKVSKIVHIKRYSQVLYMCRGVINDKVQKHNIFYDVRLM